MVGAMNHNPPMVSVIIPTFNRSDMLKDAVASVLDQDYGNAELIVVDDGSTDATVQTLASYQDRLRLLRQENRGVSAARNAGIRAAAGTLIALLDSDDLWLPGKLRAQVDYFEAHPEALICQTEEIWIRNGVRVNPGKRHRKQAGDIFERSLALCLVSPSAVMMRKSLLDEVGAFRRTPAGLRRLRPVAAHRLEASDPPDRHAPDRQTRRPCRPAFPHARTGQVPHPVHLQPAGPRVSFKKTATGIR